MENKRIEEIQRGTAYPESRSVYQALLQVWNECQQENNKEIKELKAEIETANFNIKAEREANILLSNENTKLKEQRDSLLNTIEDDSLKIERQKSQVLELKEQAKKDKEVIDAIPKCKHCGFWESKHSKGTNLCPDRFKFFTAKE